MRTAEKQLVKAFWAENVDQLSNGIVDSRLMQRAYACGTVVKDYHDRIEGLGRRKIFEGAPRFVSSLTEDQLLGCITYHFLADYFDDWHFEDEENVLSLQRYVQAWLEKVSDLPVPPVDTITYTLTGCRLSLPGHPDEQRRVVFSLGGEVRITDCMVERPTRHVVKGTTKTRSECLDTDTAIELFTALYSLPGLQPGQVIPIPMLNATVNVRLKSKHHPKAKKDIRWLDDDTEAFIELLYQALHKVGLDSDEDS